MAGRQFFEARRPIYGEQPAILLPKVAYIAFKGFNGGYDTDPGLGGFTVSIEPTPPTMPDAGVEKVLAEA